MILDRIPSPYKEYAEQFLPLKIKYLLIGESPPATPEGEEIRYVYNPENVRGNHVLLSTVACSFLGKPFRVDNGDKKEFLLQLKEKGIFLIDATYTPINKLKKRDRLEKIKDSYKCLKPAIEKLALDKNAKLMLIHNNVITAIGERLKKDFDSYKGCYIGFPRYYDDPRFIGLIRQD